MKILFVVKPFIIEPLGLLYLSSAIKNAGHEVDLALTSEDLETKVNTYKPEFIGYSIITGNQDFYDGINKRLKERHRFVSVAGGPHPTFFPESLEHSSFDAICRGEGERAVVQLLDNPNSTATPNFWFKHDGKIIINLVQPLIEQLDGITFPERGIVFQYPQIRDGPIKHFITSRGCPFNCSYCFNESYYGLYKGKGKRVRYRTVDNVLEEVEQVITSSPTKMVYFQDDTFILRADWIKEFSEKYKSRIGLPFHCHTRANLVTEGIVDDLARAGCYSVHIAAESGSDKVRREILNRLMSDEQIYSAGGILKKRGIRVMLQNMLGLPYTTLEDDFRTLEMNIQAQPDYAWASIFQPYPRTRLGQRCVDDSLYTGDFSDLADNFFDGSPLNIPHRNELANLQKLFAYAVANPEMYHSGELRKMIRVPHEKIKDDLDKLYNDFRRKADKILYGVDL
jgi:radical SAM superfamily enzyme YgiQ (UPF0313 family)